MKKIIIASFCVVISMIISISSVNLTINQQSTFSLKELVLVSKVNAEDVEEIPVSCSRNCSRDARCWAYAHEYCGNTAGVEGLCFFNGDQSTSCSSPCC